MFKKNDIVRIIGSIYAMDFRKGRINSESDDDVYCVFVGDEPKWIEERYLFKEDSLSYKILKFFKRKSYNRYKQIFKDE